MARVERFWLWLCAALAGGECVGFACGAMTALGWIAAFLIVPVGFWGYGYRIKGWVFAVFFLLGMSLSLFTIRREHAVRQHLQNRVQGDPVAVRGVIAALSPSRPTREGLVWYSAVVELGALTVRAHFPLPTAAAPPQVGEHWQFQGWLSPADARKLPKLWMKGDRTHAVKLPDTLGTRLQKMLAFLRADLSRRAGLGLSHDPDAAALNRAILLGERAALDPAVKADFINAGTIHIFAISGMHVMIVASVLFYLLLLVGCPLRWMGVALIPILWLYTGIIGRPPSAVRATLMTSLYYLAPIFWRKKNMLIAWALTFLLVHMVNPSLLFHVGNLLSFTVMLGIAVWLSWGPQLRTQLAQGFAVTLVAWAAGVPIAACTFARFTAGGIFANLLLMAVTDLSIVLSVLGCLTSFVWEPLAVHLNNFSALMVRFMSYISSFVAQVPGSSVEIAPWSITMCVLWYVALGLIIWWTRALAKNDKFLYAIRKPLQGDKQI